MSNSVICALIGGVTLGGTFGYLFGRLDGWKAGVAWAQARIFGH